MSKFEIAYPIIKEKLRTMINENDKVVIIPWSFANELETKKIDEFFNEKRRNKYLTPLYDSGIKDKNIVVLDCYNHSKSYMINVINKSNIIILTGGNPEMIYNKITECEINGILQNYKGIILGSSAGAEIQLKEYFITKKNNYYKKFAWYKGLNIIDNDFYFDVHSVNKGRYLPSLKRISKEINKDIYCLFDDGILIYDRKLKSIECFGKVIKFERIDET